jgi:hypothetical protein
LRFVVLVGVALVEFVGAFANHVGAHVHALAAALPGPFFSSGQELRARAEAALRFIDDETVHFGAKIGFQERPDADVEPANDASAGILCDENGMVLRGF